MDDVQRRSFILSWSSCSLALSLSERFNQPNLENSSNFRMRIAMTDTLSHKCLLTQSGSRKGSMKVSRACLYDDLLASSSTFYTNKCKTGAGHYQASVFQFISSFIRQIITMDSYDYSTELSLSSIPTRLVLNETCCAHNRPR